MLTLTKVQNNCTLMCTNFEIWGLNILKVIQTFHTVRIVLYIGCSGPVVGSLTLFRHSTTTGAQLRHNDFRIFTDPSRIYT